MAEFSREQYFVRRQENFWARHRAVASYRECKKLKNNIPFRLKFYARKRIKNALGKGGLRPAKGISSFVGCTGKFLAEHLASQFRNGMTLENHGRIWEIDHITPLAAFDLSDPHQLSVASHWTNLQPLLVSENRAKRDTIQ